MNKVAKAIRINFFWGGGTLEKNQKHTETRRMLNKNKTAESK